MARQKHHPDAEGLLEKLQALRDHLADHAGDVPGMEDALADLAAAAEELADDDEAIRHQSEALLHSRRIPDTQQRKYRELFDFAPDAYLTTDAFGVIEEANRAAADLLGVDPNHLPGKPLSGFVAEEDHQALRRLAVGWAPNTALRRGEVRLQPHRGDPAPAAVTVGASFDARGAVRGLRWLLRDVTERRRREEEFRALVTHSPDAVARIDTQGRFLYANPAMAELMGMPVKRMLGRDVREAGLSGPAADQWEEAIDRVLLSGEQQTFEFRVKTRPCCRWFQTRLAPEFGPDGTVMTLLAVSREVTEAKAALARAEEAEKDAGRARDGLDDEVQRQTSELIEANLALQAEVRRRKEVEADLRNTSDLLRRLFDTTDLLIAYVDADLRFVRVNRAFAGAFGGHPDDLIGRRYANLLNHPEHEAIFREVLRTGRPYRKPEDPLALPGLPESGPTFWDWTAEPVYEDDDAASGLRLTLADVTEQKRLREDVIAAGEAERQRLGQDLHDSIGQDLAGLAYVAETLAKRLSADGSPLANRAHTVADLARKAGEEARLVARGLCPVDLSDEGFTEALQALVDETHEVYGIPCTLECPGPVPIRDIAVATDLYRVAQEAIHNAIKHADAQRLRIRLTPDDGALTLAVEDDGVGLPNPPDEADGMGLRVMRYRCQRMGGRLEVSARPEGGTQVTCVLPAPRDKVAQDQETDDEPDAT